MKKNYPVIFSFYLLFYFFIAHLYSLNFISSRIFHFVTRDYFRYRDDSSDESESEDDEEIQRGDFVRGGIYAPAAQSKVNTTAARASKEVVK